MPAPAHTRHTVEGTLDEKTTTRAALIVDEALALATTRTARVVNIGVMGNLISQLKRHDVHIRASDFDEDLVTHGILDVPVHHGDHSPELVADSDVALICGETIANDTLSRLLEVALAHHTKVVIFAVSGCHFAAEYCRSFGADVVVSEPQPQYLFQGPSTINVFRRKELV